MTGRIADIKKGPSESRETFWGINDSNFNRAVKSAGVVLVEFRDSESIPCKMMEPVIEEINNEFREKIKIFKTDMKSCAKAARRYSIKSVPSMLVFKEGVSVETLSGFLRFPALRSKISIYMT